MRECSSIFTESKAFPTALWKPSHQVVNEMFGQEYFWTLQHLTTWPFASSLERSNTE